MRCLHIAIKTDKAAIAESNQSIKTIVNHDVVLGSAFMSP
jgi:hypothetical protein